MLFHFPFLITFRNIFDPPRYDEYDDDFLEQPILDASSEGDSFQEANGNIQPICHGYNMVQEENNEIDKGNSLALCFSSFKFLEESFKIINKAQEFELMENHIEFLEENDEKQDSKPLYDDYTSQSKNDEEGYDVLDIFESEQNSKNVTFLEKIHHILDMDDKEQKQVVVS
jgi:hypothetical protein